MSERTKAIIASVGTIAVAVAAAMWMSSIGAWGPAVYALVLAAIVVWLLVSAELHRGPDRTREAPPPHGNEVYWF